MNNIIRHILGGALLCAAPLAGMAQGHSMALLEVNSDARSAAMGGNAYGEAATMGLYANPTTLLYGEEATTVSAATQIYPDTDAGQLMYYVVTAGRRFGQHGVSLGFRYQGGYSFPMDEGGKLRPKDWTVDAAYSLRLADHFSASVGVSLLHSELYAKATTVGFQIAAYYRNRCGQHMDYVVGLSAENMGPALDYGDGYVKAKLPALFGGGGEMGLDLAARHRLSFSLAGQYYCLPKRSEMFLGSVGAEYTYDRLLSLRAGFRYGENDNSAVAFGVGVSHWGLTAAVSHQRGVGDNDTNLTAVSLQFSF